jgi:CRISPR/Cas system-associated exonuclease Cas4 (RecB family)
VLDPADHPRLLVSLEAATRAHPLGRKLLVCPRAADGRELLRSLAAAGVAWIGWETATPRSLALDLARPALEAAGLAPADEPDVRAAADRAIDAVLAPASVRAESPGRRAAIRSALASLRRAGVGGEMLRRSRPPHRRLSALAAALEAYADALARAGREDDPGILARAVAALRSGRASLPDASIHLLPGLPLRGAAGDLVRLLLERGAIALESDPVSGLDPPAGMLWAAGAPASPLSVLPPDPPGPADPSPVDAFSAATPADELREALRRALADGGGWDRVEIVAMDPDAYGDALDSLDARLEAAEGAGVPATFADGLGVGRTRAGRALAAYLRWAGEGCPAEILRRLLDVGDVAAPGRWRRVGGHALAGRLRALRIGRGRGRYLPAIDAARRRLEYAPEELIVDAASPGTTDGTATRAGKELDALRAMLAPLLAATPAGPDAFDDGDPRTSPAALAAGALAFLERVPEGDAANRAARALLRARLLRAAETLTRETSWREATADLAALLDMRVAAARGEAGSWTSASGRVHLSGVRSGGFACRPRTFVVGLGADAAGRRAAGDPLLTDAVRERINALSGAPVPPLATRVERAAEARFRRAALFARLRGRVTLGLAAGADGQAASVPEVARAMRAGEVGPDGRDDAVHPPPIASPVPRDGRLLDGRDAWLAALAGGGTGGGRRIVRAAFPGLDRGAIAAEARAAGHATAYHGVVRRTGDEPRPAAFSASALEALGTCPRRYFYRFVLGISPTDEPARMDAWLTPAQRGTLLHRVYERSLREAREADEDVASPAFAALADSVLDGEVSRAAARVPPPSRAVLQAEIDGLRRDVGCWAELVRIDPPGWIHLEYRFEPGADDDGPAVPLRGIIDRVDEPAPGRLRLVDYKTGRPDAYRPARPLAGGRRVQHVVYATAARRLLGAEVDAAEFHFPTRAGRNERIRLPVPAPGEAEALLGRMAALAADGPYLPTDDAADCRFCGFAAVCRASVDEHGGTTSPPAAWMKRAGIHLPEGAPVAWLRGLDG